MKNLDIYGNEVEIPDPPRGRGKTPTMQAMFGLTEGKTCKSCKHCFGYERSRVWYKCELWLEFFPGGGHSAAADIRLKNPACGKYEEETQTNDS